MKKISILFFGLVMVLSLASTLKFAAEGNAEATAVSIVAFVGSATFMPSGEKQGVLGFNNKSYFTMADPDTYTKAEKELYTHIMKNGREQTKLNLQSGNSRIRTYVSNFRFEIADAAAGKVILFDASKTFVEGAIPEEWQNGRLPEGFNIAVSHIRAGFVADGTITTPKAGVAYASLVNSWPAALRNGRVTFFQGGQIKESVAANALGTIGATINALGVSDSLALESPMILEEVKGTSIELYCADAQAFASPAGANLLEITLMGAYVSNRS